jgi:selenide,water dikinase
VSARVRVLLVGGGHTHLEILRRAALERPREIEWALLSASSRHHYSGMVPGYLAGSYSEEEIVFDLPQLAHLAGASFTEGRASELDTRRRIVGLEGGRELAYDFVSLGIGSGTRGADTPGIREHAATVKPIGRAVDLKRRIEALAGSDRDPATACIVGAGAAGMEIACAIAAVLDRAGRGRNVSILEANAEILAGYSDRFRRRALDVLDAKSITVRMRTEVAVVEASAVVLADGLRLPSDLTVWLTGPEAQPIFRASGLAVDSRGFLLVDDALRSITDPRVYAVGDCATLASHPETPKAGVYAVRQGPVLWRSLLAAARGGELPRYQPQQGFLSILNTADGRALLRWDPVVSWSRWAWWLKDAIDRRFMRKYQRLTVDPLAPRSTTP